MNGWSKARQLKQGARRKQKSIFLAMSAVFVLIFVLMSTAAGAGVGMRVSTTAAGVQANGSSFVSDVSSDGLYIAFDSDASNLVAGDTNGLRDVFVKNSVSGQIARVSTSSAGAQQYGEKPSISADGRYVAFQSAASGLVAGDTNSKVDVFVKDTQTGTTRKLSTGSLGAENPDVSADGHFVAFDDNVNCYAYGWCEKWVRIANVQTGAIVSYSSLSGYNPSISADGRYVAFEHLGHVYLHDTLLQLPSGEVYTQIDRDANGDCIYWGEEEMGCTSSSVSISGDGRYTAFESNAMNLGCPDTICIFVKDMQTGAIAIGSALGWGSYSPSISADGQKLAYVYGENIVGFYQNAYHKNLATGEVTKVSTDGAGTTGNNHSSRPAISGDGTSVAFSSTATNLVTGDTNGAADIFLTQVAAAPPADTVAPVVSNIQPSGTIGASSATVSAYFSDADPSSGIDVASASLTVSGGTVSDCVATAAGITCTASGLADGEHTINVSVADNEGNTGSGSGSFTVDTCQPAKPALGISSMVPSWASYADYQAGLLTVSLSIANAGPGNAYGLGLVGAVNTMGVTTASGIPGPVGNVDAGTSQLVGVKYQVPAGVNTFKSSIYATAADACNEIYSYPGPMPGA